MQKIKLTDSALMVPILTVIFAIIFTILCPPVSAQPLKVEEISSLKIYVYAGETAHVKAELTIKNLADNPLVPGIGEIRLQKVQPAKIWIFSIPMTERREAVDVENVRAYSENTKFKTRVEVKGDYTVIYYEIWYPIEPGKSINLTIEYDADLVEKGLLFKTITIPVGADTDIRNLEITLDSDWNPCFVNPPMQGGWKAQLPANHITFFTAEFSLLPLPMLPVRGSILLWGSVLLLVTLLLTGITLRRRRSRRRGEEGSEGENKE